MGSGTSKKATPTQDPGGSARHGKTAIKTQQSDLKSIPTQVADSAKLCKDTLSDTSVGKETSAADTQEPRRHKARSEAFLTEVPQPWLDVLNEVADSDLWTDSRSERPEWRENLTKADELANLPRKALSPETKMAAYKGELFIPELPDMRRKVIVFVSSTFTDTKAERNQLMKDVYPYLRDICRRLGLEFGTIDMRWGVTDEATKHHGTVDMCVQEIQRCVKESCGPAFLCILSHKYGYRPVPATIKEAEYEKIMAYLINNQFDISLQKAFYQLDKNALEHEYVLRSMQNDEDQTLWWENIDKIQEQMRTAVVECFNGNPEPCDKYFVSVTEMEIQSGAFTNRLRDRQTCFMIRELSDIQNKMHQHRKLIDMKESQIDMNAQQRLDNLVQKKLPEHIKPKSIQMFDYEHANVHSTICSVRQFCDEVCQSLVEMVFDNYKERGDVESDSEFAEVLQHLKLAEGKRSLFIGREKELSEVNAYLKGKRESSKPLVVYGSSGSGKTSLMAVAAEKAKKLSPKSVVVVRFIGTTSQSGSIRSLLYSICKQIAHAYSLDISLVPESTIELADYFCNILKNIPKAFPLILLLDSLDQLSASDNGRKLEWLGVDRKLPKNVKIVVSTLETDTFSILQKHIPSGNFVNVVKLLPGEGPEILNKMLKTEGRRLTEVQMKVVMKAFLNSPFPLYLNLVANFTTKWKSFDVVTADDISITIKGMITLLFERLEKKFGKLFVSRALAYITASKHGLTQGELEDILSCDDETLDSIFQYWTPPIRRIPPLLWARVRHELGQYLSERGSDDVTVMSWFHRQFKESAEERYLCSGDGANNNHIAHLALADYFAGNWSEGKSYIPKSSNTNATINKDRGIAKQPFVFGSKTGVNAINRRKLRELSYHLLKINDCDRFTDLVMNLEYIRTKFEADMGYEYFSELAEGARIFENGDLVKMSRFIGSNLSFLLREHMAIYQLASQQPENHPVRTRLRDLKEVPVTIVTNKSALNDPVQEACELTLQGHTETPFACAISSKGDRIVSTSIDGCLRVWDSLTGADIAVNTSDLPTKEAGAEKRISFGMGMRVHTVNPCCFSREGDTIAVGTENGDVIIFDNDGTKVKHEATENDFVTCIQYSPDNRLLATGFNNGKLYMWNAETLQHCETLQLDYTIVDLDFSPTGDSLAVAWDMGLSMVSFGPITLQWSVRNPAARSKQQRNTRRAQRPDIVICCCYHPSGQRVMTGSADNHITIWDVTSESGECITKLGGHSAWIWSIKITKDGDQMFTASSDRSIKVWKNDGEDQWTVTSTVYGHSHRVICLAIDLCAELKLVSASLDCSLKVWNLKALKNSKCVSDPVDQDLHFNTLAISPSGLQIAKSTGWARCVQVRSLEAKNDNEAIETDSLHGFIKKAEFTADGGKLVVLDHGHRGDYLPNSALKAKCVVYDAIDCKQIEDLTKALDDNDGPTAFSCSNLYITVGTFLGWIVLFDIDTYQVVTKWKLQPNITTITCSLSGDHVFASTGVMGELWNIKDSEHTLLRKLPDHDSVITISAFSPDGLFIVAGVESGKVYIWKVSDNSIIPMHKLTSHVAPIKDINFSKSGGFMVTCADLTTRVWNMESNFEQKGVYYAPVNCAVFRGDQDILTGDATGKLNTFCFE